MFFVPIIAGWALGVTSAKLIDTRQSRALSLSKGKTRIVPNTTPRPSPKKQVESRLKKVDDNYLAKKLAPDRFVPASDKVCREVPYADRSPWKSHVVPEDVVSAEKGIAGDSTTVMDDARLLGKYVRRYWHPYWSIGVIAGIGLMGITFYRLLYAQAVRKIIDVGMGKGSAVMLKEVMKLAIALPASFGLALLGERLLARLTSRMGNDIRHDLFIHLHTLSQDFHNDTKMGDLVARFSIDMEKLEKAISEGLVKDVGNGIMVIANFIVMLAFSPAMTLLALIPLVPILYPTTRATQYISKKLLRLNRQKALTINALQESLRGQKLIAGFGLQPLFAGYFDDELTRLEDAKTDGMFSATSFMQTYTFTSNLNLLWVFATGTLLVISGSVTIGTVIAFITLANNLHNTLASIINLGGQRWLEASAVVRRIEELFQQVPQITDAVDAYPLPPFQHQLRFEELSFSYDGVQRQLQGVDLSIEAGQFVAFVGPSGAGKSTVFNLLMRFYDVSEGRITIDGHDLREVTQASLRAQMGVVLQETFLFNTTILDNIRIIKPDADEAAVIAAAKAAELHDFVQSLPAGYQTIVGEAGGRLSGGQCQRIAVARALLYDPPILLLDEATSSLSAEMADAIMETIVALAGKHTIIMITHQLQAVVKADTIFVLDQGRLVEQGTHADLLATDGLYQHLWSTQNSHMLQLVAENGRGNDVHPAITVPPNGYQRAQEKEGAVT